jgi:hypothetical protein
MKKTLAYLVILLVLAFFAWYLLLRGDSNPFGVNEAAFTVKDTANIGKIFMADNGGQSLLLERTDSGWVVNKQYKVMPAPMVQLLTTLNRQAAISPVPDAARNNVIKALSGDAVKVEVYNRKGDKLTVFYVGNEAYKFTGTLMLTEGATKPYLVKIDDFSGYLRPRYSTDIKDWRDRTIFNLLPDQIKTITVQYPAHPVNSFIIQNNNGDVTVNTDSAVIKANTFNKRRASVYLKFFTNINAEGYANGDFGLDSTLRSVPKKCSIDVATNAGNTKHIDVYWMPLNRRSKNLLTADRYTPDDYDPDRFFAVINNAKDTVVIQKFVFEKIFRNGYEFYQPDGTPDIQDQKHPLTRPQGTTVDMNK